MLIAIVTWFTKITGWPAQAAVFRIKYIYEDNSIHSQNMKGPFIAVSNHTSVYDFAAYLFVFFWHILHTPMAEVLFAQKPLCYLLKAWGGVEVKRKENDFNFLAELETVLKKDGVVLAFPESRIPLPHEEKPLEFKPSIAYLALKTGCPVIPLYTNGKYFTKVRTRIVIGKPLYLREYCSNPSDTKNSILEANDAMRNKIIELGQMINE